jgi:hypothetical protein
MSMHNKLVNDKIAEAISAAAKLREPAEGNPQRKEKTNGKAPRAIPAGVTVEDFHAYMPKHSYIYVPTGEMWPASSINSRLPPIELQGAEKLVPAAKWLDQNRPVEQMTWAPGEPRLIRDRLVADGGWTHREGVSCFNLYRPPRSPSGNPAAAAPRIEHVRKVYDGDADHIFKWLAHRVQKPQEKINHALVLGGNQGVGKDTLLDPVKQAVGPWNFGEVSP